MELEDSIEFEYGKRNLRVKERKVYNDQKIDDEIEGKRTFDLEEKLADKKFLQDLSDILIELNGNEFDLRYIQEHGFNTPILFKTKKGLGMKMPDPQLFSVMDVKSYVGARRRIEVFDCDTHQPEEMSVHHWVRYYTDSERDKILNVTSLEFSHTGLERIVECPTMVRENLDWVSLVWPEYLINEQKDGTNLVESMKYPKVRKYVLMSVAGCYTDFHIDFGGTSVWYHVLKGAKVFWLIQPSAKNLEIYEKWTLSGRQSDVFFGDLVDKCYRVHLVSGDTFMIPTGWIHGVYTPDDSLVFGGNFLHSYNIPMQLKVYDIEENTHVPRKLRYPFYAEIHWYMIKSYVDVLERDIDEKRRMEFEADADAGAFKLVNDEINQVKDEKPKSKWQNVHLTVYELEGLKLVCERFRRWSYAKLNYPKDLKEDSMELIDRLEELLQHHEEDDQILACRGINFFKQVKEDETKVEEMKLPPISPLNTPLKKPDFPSSYSALNDVKPSPKVKEEKKPPATKKEGLVKKLPSKQVHVKKQESIKQRLKQNSVKTKEKLKKEKEKPVVEKKKANIIRRVRCRKCKGCNAENCNKCKFCLDMRSNGGENRLRKSCMNRFCTNPQLPSYAVCKICERGRSEISWVLMECSICGEIVHRSCLKRKKPCKLSKVNNCWECPDCYEKKSNTQVTEEEPIKVQKKLINGHVKVQNLKKLIQMKKIKINKKDCNVLLKRKLKTDQENDSCSEDDEPLAKRVQKTKVTENNTPNNEHEFDKSLLSSQPPTLQIVHPVNVVRPPPLASPYIYCVLEDDENHPLSNQLWINIFKHIDRKDICNCMLVCKAWNQWCLNHTLWDEINVSNNSITPSMLKGIVRRQPSVINLTSTNISCKQLEWLLKRLPRLNGLNLSLNTASAVSSLMRITCPPLKYLNLAWCDAIYDRFMVQLLSSVRVGKTSSVGISRLIFVERFILTGCDISDEAVECILSTLPKLLELDISHCTRISEKAFTSIFKGSHVCKDTFKKILCVGCPLLTESIVEKFTSNEGYPELVINKS